MERRLFLTGPTGSGKSSLLRRALGARLCGAGGFVMRAERGTYGELTGFTLAPAAAAGGVSGFAEERFLDCTRFPPRTDNEVFRTTGVRLLEESAWYPFVLLDEIGGFELVIPQFRTALEALLRSDRPILGALKTAEEAEAMLEALGLGEKARSYVQALHRTLAEAPDARVLTVSGPEDAAALRAVEDWAQAWLG